MTATGDRYRYSLLASSDLACCVHSISASKPIPDSATSFLIHPAAGAPEGFPEVLLVHTDADSTYTAGNGWHTDVSCDARPP